MLGVWHFSFTVSDIDRSVDFYTRVLDFELVHTQRQNNEYTPSLVGYSDADLDVAQLVVPGQPRFLSTHDLELVHYRSPVGRRGDTNISNPGAAHLALGVTDMDLWYRRLLDERVETVSPPNLISAGVNAGGSAMYFYDPDRIVLELVQPPPAVLDRLRDPDSPEGNQP
ncbi:MAG: hypothetical protein GEU79_03740 [Acidimicrobiia bacterium]|nr:hypothetical protein [Acidimicrobiia bacterium]